MKAFILTILSCILSSVVNIFAMDNNAVVKVEIEASTDDPSYASIKKFLAGDEIIVSYISSPCFYCKGENAENFTDYLKRKVKGTCFEKDGVSLMDIRGNAAAYGNNDGWYILNEIALESGILAQKMTSNAIMAFDPYSKDVVYTENVYSPKIVVETMPLDKYSKIQPLAPVLLEYFIFKESGGNSSMITLYKDTKFMVYLKKKFEDFQLSLHK